MSSIRYYCFVFSMFLTSCLFCQQQQNGINFQPQSRWKALIEKSKKENKPLFVEYYATWCVPCKTLEKDVFSNDTVGRFINQNFISARFQFDTSENDNEQIKANYKDAHDLVERYNISVLPTLLYFSPEGILLHKGTGSLSKSSFLSLSQEALDPAKQYYTLLSKFYNHTLDPKYFFDLQTTAFKLKDKVVVDSTTKVYFSEYLPKMSEAELLTKQNLFFISQHLDLIKPKDRIFETIRHNTAKTDTLTFAGFSSEFVSNVILNTEIYNKLWRFDTAGKLTILGTPNWNSLRSLIAQRYDDLSLPVDKLILRAKISDYLRRENWKEYSNSVTAAMNTYLAKNHADYLELLSDDALPQYPYNTVGWALNGAAWRMFQKSKDPEILRQALSWIDFAIKAEDPQKSFLHQYFDTKAHLLFALGKKYEAILSEIKAIEIMLANDSRLRTGYYKEYNDVLIEFTK